MSFKLQLRSVFGVLLTTIAVGAVVAGGVGYRASLQEQAQTSSSLLAQLRKVQIATDELSALDNKMIGLYESLEEAAKTAKAATTPKVKPASELVDLAAGLNPSHAALKDNSFYHWQQNIPKKPAAGKDAKSAKPRPYFLPGNEVLKLLVEQGKALDAALARYAKAGDGTVPPDVEAPYLACRVRLDDTIARVKKHARTDMQKNGPQLALEVHGYLKKIQMAAGEQLQKTFTPSNPAGTPSAAEFKGYLEASIPSLNFGARGKELDAVYSPELLKYFDTLVPKPAPPSKPFADLVGKGGEFLVHLSVTSEEVVKEFKAQTNSALDALQKLIKDPRENRIDAIAFAKIAEGTLRAEQACYDAFANLTDKLKAKPLSNLYPSKEPNHEVSLAVAKLVVAAIDMNAQGARFSVALDRLSEDYSDNITAWTEQEVNLYYFDDVERLLTMVTPHIDKLRNDDYSNKYQTSQVELVRAQEELVNSHARLNDARRKLGNAQEDLRLEQARLSRERERLSQAATGAGNANDASNEEVIKAKQEVDDAQVEVTAANTRLENAIKRRDAETDVVKKATLDIAVKEAEEGAITAKKELDLKQAKLNAAQSRQQLSTNKAANANSNLANLQSNVEALQQKLTAAEQDEDQKSENLRTASTAAYVNSFLVNRNFAKAVDSTPFFVTKRDGFENRLIRSSDPADRVLLYGEPMEKRIVIRGRAGDVETVRRLIALLDRPQGQSEISVYTAEISSATGTKEAEQVRTALRVLDTELARYSLYNETSQRLLRRIISAVVQTQDVSRSSLETFFRGMFPVRRSTDADKNKPEYELPSDDEVKSSIDWLLRQDPKIAQSLLSLDKRVLQQLDVRAAIRHREENYFNELPDLTSPASLAEATVALALLKSNLRENVLNAFYNSIGKQFESIVPELSESTRILQSTDYPLTFRPKSYLKVFEMGMYNTGNKVDRGWNRTVPSATGNLVYETISADLRLLQDAFTYIYSSRTQLPALQNLLSHRRSIVDLSSEMQAKLPKNWMKITPVDQKNLSTLVTQLPNLFEKLLTTTSELEKVARFYGTTINPGVLERLKIDDSPKFTKRILGIKSFGPETGEIVSDLIKYYLAWLSNFDAAFNALRKQINYVTVGGDEYHRLIARYNMAMRRIMGLYYTDVQNVLVNGDQGLLVNVNKILKWSKAEVGGWSSQTILASNRLSARMDPQASASAQQSNPVDALGGSLVLANLITTGASQNVPQILKGLKDLQGQQREPTPAIYGIGTGNVFEVTPIVDPTGQAMRFRFNFVASTRIREPGGIVDRQLNHIEQNSVNTEVVLDNLAIKRVSTFQSNVQLGLPSQKTGGLPLFKDIPFLKEIPLLGWFTYRIGGRKPIVQQSIILTQAAIYPTIEEVVESLSVTFKQQK